MAMCAQWSTHTRTRTQGGVYVHVHVLVRGKRCAEWRAKLPRHSCSFRTPVRIHVWRKHESVRKFNQQTMHAEPANGNGRRQNMRVGRRNLIEHAPHEQSRSHTNKHAFAQCSRTDRRDNLYVIWKHTERIS